jgi:deoxyribose-phosphate aldolase
MTDLRTSESKPTANHRRGRLEFELEMAQLDLRVAEAYLAFEMAQPELDVLVPLRARLSELIATQKSLIRDIQDVAPSNHCGAIVAFLA